MIIIFNKYYYILFYSIFNSIQFYSILLYCSGDEDTVKLLIDNKVDNECFFETSYLWWGENEDFCSSYPHGFDIIIAADVIYDEAQIEPLLTSVKALMKGIYIYIYI